MRRHVRGVERPRRPRRALRRRQQRGRRPARARRAACACRVHARSFQRRQRAPCASRRARSAARVGCSWMTKNQPGRPAARLRLGEVEAEERDVRVDARRGRAAAPRRSPSVVGVLRRDGVDQRVGVAAQQLAADQQHELRRRRERAAEPGRRDSTRIGGSCRDRCGVPRVSQNVAEVRVPRVAGNSRQSSSDASSWLRPTMYASMKRGLRLQQRDRVGLDRRRRPAAAARARGRAAPRTSAAGTWDARRRWCPPGAPPRAPPAAVTRA